MQRYPTGHYLPAFWLVLLLAFVLALPAHAGLPDPPNERRNQYPFALVHGFFGWGRDELLGWKHFGGLTDLQQKLREAGYHTVTPAVGPISSNWDRAAELYAQLVGGRVDYGAAHAAEHGHARYGRTFDDPLLPNLGKVVNGRLQKVNLIAHSQGVPTVRLLIELLAHGSEKERQYAQSNISPLYSGEARNWVHSVAALSGANDGSLLAHTIFHELDFENELLSAVVKLVNALGANALYDFKLDQFGIGPRRSGESFDAYFDRVMSRMLDEDNRDTAFWDLSAEGAEAINRFATAEPDVYYFSWSNNSTVRGWFTGWHYPDWKTNPLLSLPTLFMGTFNTRSADGSVPITRDWWENDGIVSTRSMSAPINGSTDLLRDYNPSHVRPGVWNFMGELDGWDHWDMLGLLDPNHSDRRDLVPFYRDVAAFLAATPAD